MCAGCTANGIKNTALHTLMFSANGHKTIDNQDALW